MDPPELASEPPWSRIGAASNSTPELRRLGWVMLGLKWKLGLLLYYSLYIVSTLIWSSD